MGKFVTFAIGAVVGVIGMWLWESNESEKLYLKLRELEAANRELEHKNTRLRARS